MIAAILFACQHDPVTAIPSPEPAVMTFSQRIRVSLPIGKPSAVPQLDGVVTLLSGESEHHGAGLSETSSGVLRLERGGQTEEIPFTANRLFEAWGYRMVVFGASGSLELSIFPPGVPIEP